MSRFHFIPRFVCVVAILLSLALLPAHVLADDFIARYNAALSTFNTAEYDQARTQFQELLQASDLKPTYTDNCYFWMGESYYAQKSWLDAITCFFKVLEYPRSNKEEDARMKIALSWFNLGDRGRACTETHSLLNLFPESRFAVRAQQLAELSCAKQ